MHESNRMCKGGSRENTLAKYNNAHPVGRFPRRFDEEQPPAPPPAPSGPKLIPPLSSVVTPKDINKMFGITASDIDKYSRLIFPITFVCFQELLKYHHQSKAFTFCTFRHFCTFYHWWYLNSPFQLMYWIIYQHLSDIIVEDLVFLQKEWDFWL